MIRKRFTMSYDRDDHCLWIGVYDFAIAIKFNTIRGMIRIYHDAR